MTTRIILTISILTLNYVNSFSQTTKEKIDRMTISYYGDSLIAQQYELIVKSKRVYFITPHASYLHIKGEKYKRRIKFSKDKKNEIFSQIGKLTWTGLEQNKDRSNGTRYYSVNVYKEDHLIDNYKVSEELLPSDFKTLYDAISSRQ